jgi:hypothetical protein
MIDSVSSLVQILEQADRSDGWRVRTKQNVQFLDEALGRPISDRLTGSGALEAIHGSHNHESKPDEKAQFILLEQFRRPAQENLWPSVARMLEQGSPAKAGKARDEGFGYLGFALYHRHGEFPACIRWGFTMEARDKVWDGAERVLGGKLFPERLDSVGGTGLSLLPRRPVSGFAPRGKASALWLMCLGHQMVVDDLRACSSTAAIVDAACRDLEILFRALTK